MRSIPPLLMVLAILASPALARAADPAAARAQLETGYGLKEEGKYQEALPHLLESLRLDPQLKTLTARTTSGSSSTRSSTG
jgi:tetratricopeptide (TPR) repeat protein